MRVCMVSDFFYPASGGVESHIYELSQCLIARGHTVVVVTPSRPPPLAPPHEGVAEPGGVARCGVRYMTNGLKVYYWPMHCFFFGTILPTVVTTLPLFRTIMVRERVDIVHGHAAFSPLTHECLLHAACLGVATVFTDHSLFGFADTSAVLTNSLLSLTLSACGHCICVSYTGKENTVLRAAVASHRVSVIPNAVDAAVFNPAAAAAAEAAEQGDTKQQQQQQQQQEKEKDVVVMESDEFDNCDDNLCCHGADVDQWDEVEEQVENDEEVEEEERCVNKNEEEMLTTPRVCDSSVVDTTKSSVDCTVSSRNPIHPSPTTTTTTSPSSATAAAAPVTVVMVSRLVYRKGADLLAALLPAACHQLPHVRFVIGGDGDRRPLLDETVERHRLADRVTLLGALDHQQVAPLLAAADIYLNCSLTEAFCIAMLEAASCGLLVVSTRVGGVAEVLPEDMLLLAEPTVAALCVALRRAVARLRRETPADRWRRHWRLTRGYSWPDVAARTELVYRSVLAEHAGGGGGGGGLRRRKYSGGGGGGVARVRRLVARRGLFAALLLAMLRVWRVVALLLDWWRPLDAIEPAPSLRPLSDRHRHPRHRQLPT